MKSIVATAAAIVATVFAAPAFAAEPPPLPYGQVAPGPTNPWPGKQFDIAFYVETVTASPKESVWGKWANVRCTQTNFFPRGEGIVFHITAINARTGKIVEPVDVKYAYLKIPGQPNFKLKYGPHGRDPATAPWTWYYRWDVPLDYPLGVVPFEVVLKLKGWPASKVAVFKQMPLSLEQLTIVETRTPL